MEKYRYRYRSKFSRTILVHLSTLSYIVGTVPTYLYSIQKIYLKRKWKEHEKYLAALLKYPTVIPRAPGFLIGIGFEHTGIENRAIHLLHYHKITKALDLKGTGTQDLIWLKVVSLERS
jgi:hypothetical protein